MKNDPHRRNYYRHDRYIVVHIFHSASSSDLRRLSSRLRSIMQFNCARAMMNMKQSISNIVMLLAYCVGYRRRDRESGAREREE